MSLFENIKIWNINGTANVPLLQNEVRSIEKRRWYGITLAKSGKIIYRHNGKEYVSDPEHVVFLPQNASYNFECKHSGLFPVINFIASPDFIKKDFCSIKIKNTEQLFKAYKLLEQAILFKNTGGSIKAYSLLYEIFYQIECQQEDRFSDTKILNPVIEMIEERFGDPELSNSNLALSVNISEVYLRKLFNKTYGMPVHKYLLNFRIKKAQSLLSDRTLSITQVSIKTGFSSVYHFCRSFKNETGYTPTQFRERNLEFM